MSSGLETISYMYINLSCSKYFSDQALVIITGAQLKAGTGLKMQTGGGGGDELSNRSDRDRAADDLGHRDVTRTLSREL